VTTAQDVLNVARSLIGVHETPDGSNVAPPITTWAKQYGYSTGDAWCSWTVSFEFYHTADAIDGAALIYNHPSGYSGDFRLMGEQHSLTVPSPVPGAIDVMDFDGKPDFTDHVGIVESVNTDGSWVNIEGNHQNQVMRVTRRPGGGSHWFIMPKYTEAPKPEPKSKDEEDDDMYWSEVNKAACVPAMTQGEMKCYLDITPQYGNPAQVRFQAKRDNGDYVGKAEVHDIGAEISYRFEVGRHFKISDIGGTTVKVEVLSGGPVVVTRKQTL